MPVSHRSSRKNACKLLPAKLKMTSIPRLKQCQHFRLASQIRTTHWRNSTATTQLPTMDRNQEAATIDKENCPQMHPKRPLICCKIQLFLSPGTLLDRKGFLVIFIIQYNNMLVCIAVHHSCPLISYQLRRHIKNFTCSFTLGRFPEYLFFSTAAVSSTLNEPREILVVNGRVDSRLFSKLLISFILTTLCFACCMVFVLTSLITRILYLTISYTLTPERKLQRSRRRGGEKTLQG